MKKLSTFLTIEIFNKECDEDWSFKIRLWFHNVYSDNFFREWLIWYLYFGFFNSILIPHRLFNATIWFICKWLYLPNPFTMDRMWQFFNQWTAGLNSFPSKLVNLPRLGNQICHSIFELLFLILLLLSFKITSLPMHQCSVSLWWFALTNFIIFVTGMHGSAQELHVCVL